MSTPADPAAGPPGPRLRRLEARFLRPHRGAILGALAGMLVQSALLLPIPLLQGRVLDRLVSHARDDSDAAGRAIALALAATVACLLVRLALAWKVGAVMSRVGLEVARELTDAMHRKLQRLPMAYFDRRQTGSLMARLTDDVGSLLIFLNAASLQLASSLVMAAGIAAVLGWLQWRLALACFVVAPAAALNHGLFARATREQARRTREQVAAIYALLSERLSALRVIRAFAREEAEVAEFDLRIDAHRETGRASMRVDAARGAAAALIVGLGSAGVLAYGASLVGRGRMTVGELLAFYALVGQLYLPIVRLSGAQAMLASTRAAVDRMADLLDEPEAMVDRPDARPVRRPRGALAFRDVSFDHAAGGRPALDRVSLEVEPGTSVGVFGASGSGKSTLLALAARLYDPAEGRGSVLFDGRDVRDWRLADLRRAVALVPQQAVLFEGTILSNLTYAAPDATRAAIRRALEAADLAGAVDSLPLGLETPVGERGRTLSGGQRQRLALARALIADPAVLLLDDCTSALDAGTEARVLDALDRLLPGRTRLIVSHKIASVRRADRIVVLDSGRIAELGTHAELLALGGLYASACRRQAQPARPSASLVGLP